MNKIYLLFFLFSGNFCYLLNALPQYRLTDVRIVGGSNAEHGQFPYQACLQYRTGSLFCSGAIISEKTILTAAHCLALNSVKNVQVALGVTLLSEGGVIYEPNEFIIHPSYNRLTMESDIALIQLKNTISFNKFIQPIPLVKTNELNSNDNQDAILAGWGYIYTHGAGLPDALQFVNLRTISNDECKRRIIGINWGIRDSQICTLTKAGEGACNGDSGGPLVIDGKAAGVVSWGLPCARGAPDVFTRISSFINWISKYSTL